MTRTALLMIDFQRDFCAAGGYSDRFAGLEWVLPIIAPARRLLEAARRAGHLVVHTREGYAPDLSDCSPAKLQRSRNAGSEIGSVVEVPSAASSPGPTVTCTAPLYGLASMMVTACVPAS